MKLTDADYERYAVDANDWATGYVFPPEGVERLIAERVAEERERIAQAIEALPIMRTPKGTQHWDRRSPGAMRTDAAAIARTTPAKEES